MNYRRATPGSRGDSTLGCVFWIAVLVIFGMICWQAIPVKIRTAELHDYMDDQAQRAGSLSTENLKKRILRRAKDLELPVTEDDLTIRKTANRIFMEVEYVVPLEFPFYTFNWRFDHRVDLPYFIV